MPLATRARRAGQFAMDKLEVVHVVVGGEVVMFLWFVVGTVQGAIRGGLATAAAHSIVGPGIAGAALVLLLLLHRSSERVFGLSR